MSQIFEFVSNHPFLWMGFMVTLGMLAFTEYTRMFSGVSQLSPYASTRMLNEEDALLIDVRSEKEFKAGHLSGARSIPAASFERHSHEIEKFKDRPVILYCDTGMRSQRAAGAYRKAGFEKIYNLAGGLSAWEKANLPVVARG